MNVRDRIWMLPIGVAIAFVLSGTLNLALNARSASHLETLRSVDNPYLERLVRITYGVDEMRTALQSAVAEGEPVKINDALAAAQSVRKALAEMSLLEGKAPVSTQIKDAFDGYDSSALATTRSLLAHTDTVSQARQMRTAQELLANRLSERQVDARAALEARFTSVADAQRLCQWASALTALVVLVGLAAGSRQIVASVWRELQTTQAQLLAAARVAGMAEIATNVLHNVGNVLNSVNISTGLLTSQLRNSRLKGLARAVKLLDQHADDPGHFLTQDSKGKLLPGYLRELAATLEREQSAMTVELLALSKSVDHIKEVVATQQSYAGTSSVAQPTEVTALVEDALRMNAGALLRHKVDVVKDIAHLPKLLLDRNRMLQILVNLIGNAKHAINDAGAAEPRISIAAAFDEQGGTRLLRLTVSDNGVGIAPQDLTRIFSHGFTTRANGHGFGLHSCVLAAKEMGGRLAAHSDGPGQGACFTLEVPTEPAAD
jgi:signal transduction histidine kinase